MPKRLVKLLDVKNEAGAIGEYEKWHAAGAVWPEVTAHIRASGVLDMEIWRFADRLVMIIEASDDYPRDVPEPAINAEWERLMEQYQLALPDAPANEKWAGAARIFSLKEQH